MRQENSVSIWTITSKNKAISSSKLSSQDPIKINLGTLDNPVHSSYLKTYFDFGFYLGITPFRFINDPLERGEYVLYKNLRQQMVCAVRHLLSIFIRITSFRQTLNSKSPRIIYYFEILQSITVTTYYLAFYNILWRSEEDIKLVLKQTARISYHKKQKQKSIIKNLNKAIFLCTTAAAISMMCPIMGYRLQLPKSPSIIMGGYLQLGRYAFFLDSKHSNATSLTSGELTFDPGQSSWGDVGLIVFQFLARSSDFTTDFFASLLVLVAAETLLDESEGFLRRILSYEKRTYKLEDILEQFEELKDYASALNGLVGPLTFAYVLDFILFFSVNLDELLIDPDWFSKLVALYFICHDSSLLYGSGRICEEILRFRTWLMKMEQGDLICSSKMTVLLADLSSNPVALTGNGKFSIDNSFVGSMMVTLITLFILTHQSKSSINMEGSELVSGHLS